MHDPRTSPFPIPGRLLGVWAHPDDEAYLSAGLMAEVVSHGGSVTLVCVTDGELGFPTTDGRAAAEKAAQRRCELRRAAASIGVHDVRFLGVRDGALVDADLDIVAAAIAGVMAAVDPDLTVTFGADGVTGHLDHVACGEAVTRAWLSTGLGELRYAARPRGWYVEWADVHAEVGALMSDRELGVDADQIDLHLELAAGCLDQKRRMLRAHASQTAGIAAHLGEEAYRRWFSEEWFRPPVAAELTEALSRSAPAGRRAPAQPARPDPAMAR